MNRKKHCPNRKRPFLEFPQTQIMVLILQITGLE
uniref:Uncharacterized protein n=1 Tax=Arundo donax TaxID=35708 RepID=A0A0A8ZF23_ARUDO